ncbi:hypothetical protein QR680_013612 [Steinernema hermaphroditum]|uniref:Defective in cullin neddylation protein n=1 Tax=Steinernema hermaphroditum TaxID=289476 RepID=A0AA39I638_9BILA|nr:hypothetical protein QR680_013612 [Steinernema hermaphroditum]
MSVVSGNSKQNALFEKYAGRKDDATDGARIGPNGCAQLIADLGIDVTDRRVLVLCALANAQTQCEFSYEELVGALQEHRVESLKDLRKFLDSYNRKMDSDDAIFQKVYKFTFGYALMLGQKALPVDTAVPYWQILITKNYALYPKFIEFVSEAKSRPKGISRDVWNMLPEFLQTVKAPKDYDENSSWPSTFDDFVEYAQA